MKRPAVPFQNLGLVFEYEHDSPPDADSAQGFKRCIQKQYPVHNYRRSLFAFSTYDTTSTRLAQVRRRRSSVFPLCGCRPSLPGLELRVHTPQAERDGELPVLLGRLLQGYSLDGRVDRLPERPRSGSRALRMRVYAAARAYHYVFSKYPHRIGDVDRGDAPGRHRHRGFQVTERVGQAARGLIEPLDKVRRLASQGERDDKSVRSAETGDLSEHYPRRHAVFRRHVESARAVHVPKDRQVDVLILR